MTSLKTIDHFYKDKASLKAKIMRDIESGIITPHQIGDIPLEFLDLTKLPGVRSENCLTPSRTYKPFRYPLGFDMNVLQNNIHWLPDEVPLHTDVKEWNTTLPAPEKNLAMHIFRLFTQNDQLVNDMYIDHYSQVFKPVELRMGIAATSNIETIHMRAYSYLLDTLGIPEKEYTVFLEYKEMVDKYDYMSQFNMRTINGIARSLVAFGGFTEGVQLFASFAMLMNFPRFNRMKGMGQIVAFSVRDESSHIGFVAELSKIFRAEFGSILDMEEIDSEVKTIARQVAANEEKFIDLAFQLGPVEGLCADQMKEYIHYTVDHRLVQFGHAPIYGITKHPLPWMEEQMNAIEHTNFFENRSSAYSKGATQGTWEAAFS